MKLIAVVDLCLLYCSTFSELYNHGYCYRQPQVPPKCSTADATSTRCGPCSLIKIIPMGFSVIKHELAKMREKHFVCFHSQPSLGKFPLLLNMFRFDIETKIKMIKALKYIHAENIATGK